MHLVNLITDTFKKCLFLLTLSLIVFSNVIAQNNSPLSRYGIGDLAPAQNIVNRAMGGVSAAYADFGLLGSPLHINFVNPASLGNLSNTKSFSNVIFDIGAEVDSRTLKSTTNTEKYKSNNTTISYLQIAFPISTKKMEKKGTTWGLALGLRPVSKINYKIETNGRLTGVDSINTLYEGSGGLNQVNLSTGIRKIGKGASHNEFSVGVSVGYSFGSKDYSTKRTLVNDTVNYAKSNYEVSSRFGGLFINTGIQYQLNTQNSGTWRFGAFANLQQKLKAKQDVIFESYGYDYTGDVATIDSVAGVKDSVGKIVIPSTLGIGFTYHSKNNKWLVGADFDCSNWGSSYQFYDKTDKVMNSWTMRVGAEYYPAKFNAAKNNYFSYLKYRAGFYFGPDYIKLDEKRNNYAVTAGASFPLSTPRYIQTRGEYVTLNTSFEIGARGNKSSASFHENFVRFNFGISMNARWFQKRIYD